MSGREKVLVAMSGGVDSSVALHLLVEHGYDAVGVTMKLWDSRDENGNLVNDSYCCSLEAVNNAKLVCEAAGVPHYTLDFRGDFREKVVNNFTAEYLRGRTPNPCIRCNSDVRWSALLEYADDLGIEWIATGHYARIDRSQPDRPTIQKGLDSHKDQSYVLWRVKQEELSRTLFPLGNLTKPEVRKIAREANLTTADVAESQEICFVPNDNYRTFIENESAAENGLNGSGKFVTPEGKTVAEHRGISHYTVGQRRGLGISGAEPVYVQVIEPDSGDITLAPRRSMFFSGCSLNDLNWHIDETDLDIVNDLIVLIRYNHEGVSCKIEWNTDGTAEVKFDEAQFAVAAGQSAVFYDGDRLLGGGIITEGFLNEETTIG